MWLFLAAKFGEFGIGELQRNPSRRSSQNSPSTAFPIPSLRPLHMHQVLGSVGSRLGLHTSGGTQQVASPGTVGQQVVVGGQHPPAHGVVPGSHSQNPSTQVCAGSVQQMAKAPVPQTCALGQQAIPCKQVSPV